MKKKPLIIISILILLLFIYFIVNKIIYNNDNFDLLIKENILLKTSLIQWSNVDDKYENKYYYSFRDNSVNVINQQLIKSDIHQYNTNWIKVDNWILYIDWVEMFKCNFSLCKYYIDKDSRYIIFVDKYLYKKFLFSKILPFSTLRVFDLKTSKHKDFPILKYEWEALNIVWIDGFFNPNYK